MVLPSPPEASTAHAFPRHPGVLGLWDVAPVVRKFGLSPSFCDKVKFFFHFVESVV